MGAHQGLIVRHQTLNKGIVRGVLSRLIFAVDKDPLDVGVALTSRVAGVIDPLGKAVDTPKASGNCPHLVLGQLGGLVQKNNVIFHTLQSVQIRIPVAIGKLDGAAPGKGNELVPVMILGDVLQLPCQNPNVVVNQLREGPTNDEDPDPGVSQGQKLGLGAHRPAFTAASGAAKAYMPGVGPKKFLLTMKWQKVLII